MFTPPGSATIRISFQSCLYYISVYTPAARGQFTITTNDSHILLFSVTVTNACDNQLTKRKGLFWFLVLELQTVTGQAHFIYFSNEKALLNVFHVLVG